MSESENNFIYPSDFEIQNIGNKLNNLMINIKLYMKPEINPKYN